MTDNNNFEEFEHAQAEPTVEVPLEPKGLRANLGGAWRSQPLFKLFVLMVVVGAVVAIAVALFSGNNPRSSVGLIKPPDLHEAPGGKSTPYHNEQTEMANKQRTEEAIQNGGSALPTPLGPGNDTGELNPAPNKEDPLNELRAEVENMNKQLQEAKQAAAAPPPAPAPQEPFDDSLAQAMQRQMGQMLDSWAPKGNKQVAVYDLEALKIERANAAAGGSGSGGSGSGTDAGKTAATTTPPAKTIVPAGTVSYAQLLTEANSDVPGPILAQVVSGPLKGARIIGQFQVANGYSDYLTLTFKLADLNGVDYKIYAIALDPDTTLGGMATEVDQRYLTRLVLPAAAGFLQGFASAIGQGNESLVTNGTTTIVDQSGRGIHQGIYAGIGAGASTASQFFQTQANLTHPLVRVASGTPMGVFFVNTVVDTPVSGTDANAMYNPNGPNGSNNPFAQNGYNGNGMPGQNNFGQGYVNNSGVYNNNNTTGGYPVLYPNPVGQGAGVGYGGFGIATQSNSYPGSSVYYAR